MYLLKEQILKQYSSSARSCVSGAWLWGEVWNEGMGFFAWLISKSVLLLLVSPVLPSPPLNMSEYWRHNHGRELFFLKLYLSILPKQVSTLLFIPNASLLVDTWGYWLWSFKSSSSGAIPGWTAWLRVNLPLPLTCFLPFLLCLCLCPLPVTQSHATQKKASAHLKPLALYGSLTISLTIKVELLLCVYKLQQFQVV